MSRMECFLLRSWLPMARRISDPDLRKLVIDLLENRIPAVDGSDCRTWLYVDRDQIAGLSGLARSSDDDLIRLWLSVMIWGYVTDHRGPSRVAEALAVGGSEMIERLRTSLDRIDSGELGDAYRGSQRMGVSRLPRVGRSFFTKWFWAVGVGAQSLPTTLLTLDDKVVATLKRLGGPWWAGRCSEDVRYVDYCALVTEVSQVLKFDGNNLCPEQIEYGLYLL